MGQSIIGQDTEPPQIYPLCIIGGVIVNSLLLHNEKYVWTTRGRKLVLEKVLNKKQNKQ